MKKKKGLLIVVAIVVVIIGVLFGNKISDFADSKKVGAPLDIMTYHQDYDSNEKMAEEKYIGNRYSVTGTITEIDSFGSDTEIHVLTTKDYHAGYVFVFTPYNEKDILNLSVGQTVTATGTLNGMIHVYGGSFENSVFETK